MKIEQLARKGILKLVAYVPGRAIEEVEKEYGVKRWIKLASNESRLGETSGRCEMAWKCLARDERIRRF